MHALYNDELFDGCTQLPGSRSWKTKCMLHFEFSMILQFATGSWNVFAKSRMQCILELKSWVAGCQNLIFQRKITENLKIISKMLNFRFHAIALHLQSFSPWFFAHGSCDFPKAWSNACSADSLNSKWFLRCELSKNTTQTSCRLATANLAGVDWKPKSVSKIPCKPIRNGLRRSHDYLLPHRMQGGVHGTQERRRCWLCVILGTIFLRKTSPYRRLWSFLRNEWKNAHVTRRNKGN